MNKLRLSSLAVLASINTAQSALPIWPAEIIARDLNVPGASWVGHVGITKAEYMDQDATFVIEVLNSYPVIQENYIPNFKLLSPYWGSRFGISDRGNKGMMILREADAQRLLGCATYTKEPRYLRSQGYWDMDKLIPTRCGYFRCDTFITAMFEAGGYISPQWVPEGQWSSLSLPLTIFNWFPKGNQDGPKSQLIKENRHVDNTKRFNEESFYNYLGNISGKVTKEEFDVLISELKDNNTLDEKREMILEFLGFEYNIDLIPILIELIKNIDRHEFPLTFNKILPTIQILYQRYDMKEYPFIKMTLEKFFLYEMINTYNKNQNLEIILRGLINLLSKKTLDSMSYLILERTKDIIPENSIKIQFELMFHNPEYEEKVISNIINLLEQENNQTLDDIVNTFVIHKLSNVGINGLTRQSKNQLLSYNMSKTNISTEKEISLLSKSLWLQVNDLLIGNI